MPRRRKPAPKIESAFGHLDVPRCDTRGARHHHPKAHGLGSAERPVRIDHPLDLAQRRWVRLESSGVIEVRMDAKKLEVVGLAGGDELARNSRRNRQERTRSLANLVRIAEMLDIRCGKA